MQTCFACEAAVTSEQKFCAECGSALDAIENHNAGPFHLVGVPHIPKPDPMIDRVIGERFQITNIVGYDRDGSFYTAIDLRTTEQVTVRIFDYRNRVTPAELTRRIEVQAERIRRINHRGIVYVRLIIHEPDLLALILESSGAATLDSFLNPLPTHDLACVTHQPRQRSVSQKVLQNLLVQIFDSVAVMHRSGQINGYITTKHILVDDNLGWSQPRIRLCPFGSKEGSASSHPDRFHYDDDRLTEAADVWYLGWLVSALDFSAVTSPVMDTIAPVIEHAMLESRTYRIQTVSELKKGLEPMFNQPCSTDALLQFGV